MALHNSFFFSCLFWFCLNSPFNNKNTQIKQQHKRFLFNPISKINEYYILCQCFFAAADLVLRILPRPFKKNDEICRPNRAFAIDYDDEQMFIDFSALWRFFPIFRSSFLILSRSHQCCSFFYILFSPSSKYFDMMEYINDDELQESKRAKKNEQKITYDDE